MKDNIPKTKPKVIDKTNPWWTDKLQQERKILCKLHKTSLKNPTPLNKDKYKKKHNEHKTHCDKAKKISWAEYKEKNNSVEVANTFRKIIESSTQHTLGTLEKTDGTITEPGTDTPRIPTVTTLPLIYTNKTNTEYH